MISTFSESSVNRQRDGKFGTVPRGEADGVDLMATAALSDDGDEWDEDDDEVCAAAEITGCTEDVDGDGYDGYCGSCADLVEEHSEGAHRDSPEDDCPDC